MQTSKTLPLPAQSLNNFLNTQRFGKSTIYFKGIVCQSLDDFKLSSKAGEFYTHFTGEVYINVKIDKVFILQVINDEFKIV